MPNIDQISVDHHHDVRVTLHRAEGENDYLVELGLPDQPPVLLAWFEARLTAARLHEAGEMARYVNGVGAIQAHTADWVTWLATEVIGYDDSDGSKPSDFGGEARTT